MKTKGVAQHCERAGEGGGRGSKVATLLVPNRAPRDRGPVSCLSARRHTHTGWLFNPRWGGHASVQLTYDGNGSNFSYTPYTPYDTPAAEGTGSRGTPAQFCGVSLGAPMIDEASMGVAPPGWSYQARADLPRRVYDLAGTVEGGNWFTRHACSVLWRQSGSAHDRRGVNG
eukprot:4766521-Prymnesium_polylepis.1